MPLVRLGLVLFCVGFLALCLQLFAQEKRGQNVAAAASSLRDDPIRWRDEAQTLQRYLTDTPYEQTCQGQHDRDLLTLALASVDLEATDTSRDASRMRSTLEQAEAQARHLLSCSPTDGRAWLDLAILNARLLGQAQAAYSAVALSARFAPHDAAALKARIRYGSWLSGQSVAKINPLLVADLGVFVNRASLADLKTLLATIGPMLLPLLKKVTVSSDDPARVALMRQVRGF